MYQIVLWIGLVDIIALVILITLLFYKFSNRLHLYLIFSCLSLLLNNVGYQLELMASSYDVKDRAECSYCKINFRRPDFRQ